ncbi:MAG: hypothetical protein ACSW8F_00110 [bacterium]
MRFIKNSLSATLTYIAILFNVFFFISIYESNVGSWYYNILMGASILYNLLFMLAAFLCSEGIKNYKESYAYMMIALGVAQLVRIAFYPMLATSNTVAISGEDVIVMTNGQFVKVVAYLIISAACLIGGAIVGIIRSRELKAHLASLGLNA